MECMYKAREVIIFFVLVSFLLFFFFKAQRDKFGRNFCKEMGH